MKRPIRRGRRTLPSYNVRLYDTTLRDGSQGEGVSFSVEDKLRITQELDRLGVHYIEGGWPLSNPKDIEFFKRARSLRLQQAKLSAFGSTGRKHSPAHTDPNLLALIETRTPVCCIFGKSWDLHVQHALQTTPQENLRMIRDSVAFLKSRGREVIYDAEHFFDGFRANWEYAVATIKAACEAGADNITLCDTNGGSLPHYVGEVVGAVRELLPHTPLGIHTHNDGECAVANSLMAVRRGVTLVQGTINGLGERCGNANLVAILPALQLKMDTPCVSTDQLRHLTETARFVAEIANQAPNDHEAYVGHSAFAHKAGVHAAAVGRLSQTYEHILPEAVGNQRRILVSELSGRSSVLLKGAEFGLSSLKDPEAVPRVIHRVKELEEQGYSFEGAEGSFALLVRRLLDKPRPYFLLKRFRVIVEEDKQTGGLVSEASLKVSVNGREEHTVAEGDGPVDALDRALRRALDPFYPSLRKVSLTDYKVRVINGVQGAAAKVRVLVQSRDDKAAWGTVGVSENLIEASWQALVDAVEFKFFKDGEKPPAK